MWIYIFNWIYRLIHIYINIHIYRSTYVCINKYRYVHIYMHIYVYVHIYIHIYMYIYIKYINTYIYIYMYTLYIYMHSMIFIWIFIHKLTCIYIRCILPGLFLEPERDVHLLACVQAHWWSLMHLLLQLWHGRARTRKSSSTGAGERGPHIMLHQGAHPWQQAGVNSAGVNLSCRVVWRGDGEGSRQPCRQIAGTAIFTWVLHAVLLHASSRFLHDSPHCKAPRRIHPLQNVVRQPEPPIQPISAAHLAMHANK